jgi:hypothetical protein
LKGAETRGSGLSGGSGGGGGSTSGSSSSSSWALAAMTGGVQQLLLWLADAAPEALERCPGGMQLAVLVTQYVARAVQLLLITSSSGSSSGSSPSWTAAAWCGPEALLGSLSERSAFRSQVAPQLLNGAGALQVAPLGMAALVEVLWHGSRPDLRQWLLERCVAAYTARPAAADVQARLQACLDECQTIGQQDRDCNWELEMQEDLAADEVQWMVEPLLRVLEGSVASDESEVLQHAAWLLEAVMQFTGGQLSEHGQRQAALLHCAAVQLAQRAELLSSRSVQALGASWRCCGRS